MDDQLKTKPVSKLLFVSLAVVLFLASSFVAFFLANNLSRNLAANKLIDQTQIQAPTVDLAKLKQDYEQQSVQILRDYLAQTNLSGMALVQASRQAQQDLLNLTLPAEYKNLHLQEVLLLGEIADLAQANNAASAAAKLDQLRQLANE